MVHHLISARRRAGLAVVALASLTAAGLAAGTSYASAGSTDAGAGPGSPRARLGQAESDAYVDVTDEGGSVETQELQTASRTLREPASRAALKAAPPGVVTDIAGSTGTVRWQGNLSPAGTLTPASSKSATQI